MRPDDFFVEDPVPSSWGTTTRHLNAALVTSLRQGPVQGHDDLEVAVGLARLVHDDLERYGTEGNPETSEPEMRDAILALRAVLERIGISDFDLPFRDYSTFKGHWVRKGCHGSWQARRNLLNDLFNPLHNRLVELETRALTSTLAQPISPHPVTGWARVDAELAELRRHFQVARSEQDYRNIGNDCVVITEALSRQVYDPQLHLREDEEQPPVAQTKLRIERYIDHAAPGSDNAELRRLARVAIEFAQRVKHSPTSSRREAGIAGDAVILLANILRRLGESE